MQRLSGSAIKLISIFSNRLLLHGIFAAPIWDIPSLLPSGLSTAGDDEKTRSVETLNLKCV